MVKNIWWGIWMHWCCRNNLHKIMVKTLKENFSDENKSNGRQRNSINLAPSRRKESKPLQWLQDWWRSFFLWRVFPPSCWTQTFAWIFFPHLFQNPHTEIWEKENDTFSIGCKRNQWLFLKPFLSYKMKHWESLLFVALVTSSLRSIPPKNQISQNSYFIEPIFVKLSLGLEMSINMPVLNLILVSLRWLQFSISVWRLFLLATPNVWYIYGWIGWFRSLLCFILCLFLH